MKKTYHIERHTRLPANHDRGARTEWQKLRHPGGQVVEFASRSEAASALIEATESLGISGVDLDDLAIVEVSDNEDVPA